MSVEFKLEKILGFRNMQEKLVLKYYEKKNQLLEENQYGFPIR